MRKAAGLTGDQLAEALGWGEKTGRTKVSKIENGKQTPSADDIAAWAQACGHPEQVPDLLDLLGDVQTVHTRWRRRLRERPRGHPGRHRPAHAGREADPQRRGRAHPRPAPDSRLRAEHHHRRSQPPTAQRHGRRTCRPGCSRQGVLYDQSKVFEFVIMEAALRLLPCPPQVMLGQLDRLMSMDLPNVTLGIIPFGPELP